MSTFVFNTTKSIINKPGATRELASVSSALGIKRPMLVTDPGIIQYGLHSGAIASFDTASMAYCVYSDVQADPSSEIVLDALAAAREHKADGVIGFGGGSSMDVAKLVAALLASEQNLDDMYGVDTITGGRYPLIQVPTTAGTGSEVTPVSVVTVSDSEKKGVVSSVLIPDVALLDPELTLGLPPQVTAATGIDAMVHAIEAYTSAQRKNPYSDMLAREALRLLSNNIVTAVNQGSNLEARGAMLYGATLAGQAFANAPVAAVHALAYPLGSYYHIPHGLSNSLVLPHVMRFNVSEAADLYAEIAPCVMQGNALLRGSSAQLAERLIEQLTVFIEQVGLPTTLEELGVEEEKLAMLADAAMLQQRLLINNPREMHRDDALAIYRQAYR